MAPGKCSQCGKSGQGAGLSRCSNCWATKYCSKECQKAAWASHKKTCKESAWKQFFRSSFGAEGVREKFLAMAEKDDLAAFIDRDESEFYTVYIRDKFMTRSDLAHSGLDKILEQEQQRTKIPALKNVISETFKFADDSSVSSALNVLAKCVAKAPGRVLYLPGAMLDLGGVAIALGRECSNIDTLLCVSSWEIDALESASPSTAEFIRLVPEVLKDFPFVTSLSLQSDSADALAGGGGDAGFERARRIEWRVVLRCVRRGDKKAVRLIYYVNEDITSFFPTELEPPGSLAAIYAPRVHLPLWDSVFAEKMKQAGGEQAIVIQDQHALHCGVSSDVFYSPPLEAAAGAAKHTEELEKVKVATEKFVTAVEAAEILHANQDHIVHSLFSDPGDLSVQPIRFNLLRAVPLSSLQKCTDDVISSFQTILGARYMARVRAEHRSFLAKEFAAVVRADGALGARPSASVAAVLRDQLGMGTEDEDPEAGQEEGWPRRGGVVGWGEEELARLREVVSEL